MARWQPLPGTLDPDLHRLVEQLRRLKDRSGLTLAALAARTPYSKSAWQRYLNGLKFPPRQAVEALGRIAGADAPRLLALWGLAERSRLDAAQRCGPTAPAPPPAPPPAPQAPPAVPAPPVRSAAPGQRLPDPPPDGPPPARRPSVRTLLLRPGRRPRQARPTAPALAPALALLLAVLLCAAAPALGGPGARTVRDTVRSLLDAPVPAPPARAPAPAGAGTPGPGIPGPGIPGPGTARPGTARPGTARPGAAQAAARSAGPRPAASRRACRAAACQGRDPLREGCARDARTANSALLPGGELRLRWSTRCAAAWADLVASGRPPSDATLVVQGRDGVLLASRASAGRSPMLAAAVPGSAVACLVAGVAEACTGSGRAGPPLLLPAIPASPAAAPPASAAAHRPGGVRPDATGAGGVRPGGPGGGLPGVNLRGATPPPSVLG
ncbi:XRE family transcriptional regulator [Streptacidiphilus sp. ASG 303]|uniref:helix-turn-helix domain-containing protein n=1 Tax=Streptacidiphilus sp. ASG 303 TaxID=2896847 RepID=UPI001E3AB94F|nr:XRE family transcriptional regulator [Streptacidiphilus sp. ASG 303]MCD0481887.1 XRE family transcriptional regulator [Streptacidiphilus sp. ASG 303]